MDDLTDDELLDFDLKRLGGFERAPRALLQEHGDAYRQQLITARWLDGYCRRRAARRGRLTSGRSEDFEAGVEDTLRDIVAHLRQGDFLPGGALYEDTINRRHE